MLEVVHVAADMLVRRVTLLPLPSNAQVNEVAGVFHHKLTPSERTRRDDPATFARYLHHLCTHTHGNIPGPVKTYGYNNLIL